MAIVKLRRTVVASIVAALLVGVVDPDASGAAVTVPTKRYLMSFHSCAPGSPNCAEPSAHLVQLAQSEDGRSWSLVPGWTSHNGSVPDVFRRGSTIYVMSVGPGPGYSSLTVSKIDLSTGAQTRATVSVSEGVGFVDPTLEQLPDGRLILYYLATGGPGYDPATCRSGESSCVKEIKSAVEVAGSDGTRFVTDPGVRISETISATQPFSDPDIFYNGREWVLYVSRAQSVHAYISATPQGTFVYKGLVSDRQGGIPAGLSVSVGETWTYVHLTSATGSVIKFGTSPDGTSTISSFTTVVDAAAFGLGTYAASPGLAVNAAGIECAACTTVPPGVGSSTTVLPGVVSKPGMGTARAGASCTQVGARANSGKTRLVCKKSGRKLVWVRS